jgi:recombinational DNA repair protein (RecF pathway)
LDRLTDKGDRQPEIYDLARTTLVDLDSLQFDARGIVLRFELQLLRMMGQLPTWQRCPQCGTGVTSPEIASQNVADGKEQDMWRTFSSQAGGILCDRCRSGGRQLIRIHRSAQETLHRFSDSDWQNIDIDHFTEEHRRAIRKVIVQYLNTLVDRKFNLHPYLEELGR